MEIVRVLPPKYVSRARQWVVTWFEHDPKSKLGHEKQRQQWFGSKEDADKFTPVE